MDNLASRVVKLLQSNRSALEELVNDYLTPEGGEIDFKNGGIEQKWSSNSGTITAFGEIDPMPDRGSWDNCTIVFPNGLKLRADHDEKFLELNGQHVDRVESVIEIKVSDAGLESTCSVKIDEPKEFVAEHLGICAYGAGFMYEYGQVDVNHIECAVREVGSYEEFMDIAEESLDKIDGEFDKGELRDIAGDYVYRAVKNSTIKLDERPTNPLNGVVHSVSIGEDELIEFGESYDDF